MDVVAAGLAAAGHTALLRALEGARHCDLLDVPALSCPAAYPARRERGEPDVARILEGMRVPRVVALLITL